MLDKTMSIADAVVDTLTDAQVYVMMIAARPQPLLTKEETETMPESHTIHLISVPTPAAVYANRGSSYWLMQALRDSENRDPLDALHDAEVLTMILAKRVATLASS